MKKLLAGLLAAGLFLGGCSMQNPEHESAGVTFFALDTVISLAAYGKDSARAVEDVRCCLLHMEEELSRTKEGSAVFAINHAGGAPTAVRADLLHIVKAAQVLSELTDDYFDITVAPAADLWGFTKPAFRVPEQNEIRQVRSKVGPNHLHTGDDAVWLDPGSEIDLGGIAKGYALEQALAIFRGYDLTGGLANLGGDIVVCGRGSSSPLWRVGIRDPDVKDSTVGVLSLTDAYILTSGGYERYFEADGRRYPHIIDPRSCLPADSDLTSVTVISSCEENNGLAADAFATALFLMGAENAAAFWRMQDRTFDLILVDTEGTVYVTEGLKDRFVLTDAHASSCIFLS